MLHVLCAPKYAFCLLLLAFQVAPQSPDLAEKVKQARELVEAGRFGAAVPLYRDLARALPNNPSVLINLGFVLHMRARDDEAVKEFQTALKLDPASNQAQLYLGAAYLGLFQPAKALDPLLKVVQAQPDNRTARELLGEAHLSLAQFALAAEQFEKLAQLDSTNPKAWNGLGRCYEGLARENLEALEKVAPESAYALALLAEARLNHADYEPAFFFYREALAKMPSLYGLHVALAEIYRKTGHADWAEIEERKESELPPLNCESSAGGASQAPGNGGNVSLRAAAGNAQSAAQEFVCEFEARRYREVVAEGKSVKMPKAFYWRSRAYAELANDAFSHLERLPPSPQLHEFRAKVQFNRREYTEAAEEWRQALKLSPGSPYIQKELALSLDMSGDHEAARGILEGLLLRAPNSGELNYLLGETELSLNKPKEAIPHLEKAVQADPASLEAQKELARAYLNAGEPRGAIPHLKAALSGDEDGSLYYQLARAYKSIGEQALANEALKKFQEAHNSFAAREKNLRPKVQITPP